VAFELQHRYEDALRCLERGHALGTARPAWRYDSAAWIERVRRRIERRPHLERVLSGTAEPAGPDDVRDAIFLGLHEQAYARVVAFVRAMEPRDLPESATMLRYNGACAAALAAGGATGAEARELRAQCVAWLRAALAVTPRDGLDHWFEDADLAGVRDPEALAALDAGERAAIEALWREVRAAKEAR
jgi:hypothetical protein